MLNYNCKAGSRQQAAGSRQQAAGSRHGDNLVGLIQYCKTPFNDLFNVSSLSSLSKLPTLIRNIRANRFGMILHKLMQISSASGISFNQKTAKIRDILLKFLAGCIRLNALTLFCLTTIFMTISSSVPAHAALTATTANTIQGTGPYLTFDAGKTKVTTTDELLGITLTDGTTSTSYKKSDLTGSNPGTSGNPLELPVAGQKLEDIKTLIPSGQTSVTLNDLVITKGFWGDADGDGNPTVTGDLEIKAVDANNNAVNLTGTLDVCNSPYQVTLTSTGGTLSTQYGDPKDTTFTGSSATYYIKPKVAVPYVCWAAPNLTNGNADYTSPSHPEWDESKGFKLQSLGTPSKNFPRTGFHGAFFDITVAGATAANVISATGTTITQGNITATLTAQKTNVVRVTLTGPNHASGGGTFTPSTFTIKSNASNTIYNFALSKWFIAKKASHPYDGSYQEGGQTVPQYCANLTPSNSYRMPSVGEYTNAKGNGWSGTLSGWGNNYYARAIGHGVKDLSGVGFNASTDEGGGLFAEWGSFDSSPYISSDFEYKNYWAVEPISPRQHVVASNVGYVTYSYPNAKGTKAACVSP